MIIVTGATHGIGRACVEKLASDGARVVATGRDAEAGRALEDIAPGVTFVPGDVSREEDCRRVIDRALDLGGGAPSGLLHKARL